MATARKLPSGSWRCRIFAGYKIIDGVKKREYKSFTASTKREAEAMAAAWAVDRKRSPDQKKVIELIEEYIDIKRPVLSPSTTRNYRGMLQSFRGSIGELRADSVKSSDIQRWIAVRAAQVQVERVKSEYALMICALKLNDVRTDFRVTFPQEPRRLAESFPTKEEMSRILTAAHGTEMYLPIVLGRYYGLRRGEILALTVSDLRDNELWIHKTMTLAEHGSVIKDSPKTDASNRIVILSDEVADLLRSVPHGVVWTKSFEAFRRQWFKILDQAGVDHFRFHLLRHMFATSCAEAGIPDFYTAKMGGWSPNALTLKRVYQNAQSDGLERSFQIVSELMHHDMRHDAHETQ